MIQRKKIAVLGGGGRTGKYIVARLLTQGYNVKLLLRTPENLQLQSPFIEILKGDALDAAAIRTLISDCNALISTIGQRPGEPLVSSQATTNVLGAMTEFGIRRYILVAGLNVDTPFDKKGAETRAATEWMKANFPLIHADRQKTYSILAASDVNWTLVRVPFIQFTDSQGEVSVSTEDCRGSRISAADIAEFVVEQLSNNTYSKAGPFIANV